MQQLFFWRTWPTESRAIYWGLLVLLLITIGFLTVGIFKGSEFVIDWEVESFRERVEVPVDTFTKGLFSFTQSAENYIVSQQFRGSLLRVNETAAYLFMALVGISLVVCLSVITGLKRFWYIVGMGLFILFLVNLKLEQLYLAGRIDKVPLIITFLLYIPASYYFHAIKPGLGLRYRLLTFSLITIIFAIAVSMLAEVGKPFLYIANYGIFGSLIITLAFILMISHEIVNGFLYIITANNNATSKFSLRHFSLVTGFYLINVLLLYLFETKIISWDFYYINPYLLLLVSSIVGIWGLITRSQVFEKVMPFKPSAAIIYLAVAIWSFATIAYFHASANDPVLKVVRDLIIYSHLGFGLMFFIYIISNFIPPLLMNLQVYKVVYQPKTMPYFTFRFAGLIAVTAMILKENVQVPIYHSISGYYNGIGDLYTANEDLYVAEQYYKLGSDYGFNNHRSNYALASLAESQNDLVTAAVYYQKSIAKRPTEYAYVNLSNIYLKNNRFFDALFTLSDAKEEFPLSGHITNNLGLIYSKTDVLDSALLMFNMSKLADGTNTIANVNYVGILARNNISLESTELAALPRNENSPASLSNLLVVSNQNSSQLEGVPLIFEDSLLNRNSSAYLANYVFNRIGTYDTTVINTILAYANHEPNYAYRESLQYMAAVALYENERISEAFQLMNFLAESNLVRAAYYFNILGLWSLENEAYEEAAAYFARAAHAIPRAKFNQAISEMEASATSSAESWLELNSNENTNETSTLMLEIIEANSLDAFQNRDDIAKYQLVRFREDLYEQENIWAFVESMENESFQAKAILDISKYYLRQNKLEKSLEAFAALNGLNVANEELYIDIQNHQLRLMVYGEDLLSMENSYNALNEQYPNSIPKTTEWFIKAKRAEYDKDTTAAAEYFNLVGRANPFLNAEIIAAANFFQINDQPDKSYDILVEAVQTNKNSPELLKAYSLQSLRVGLANYAESTLEEISSLVSEDEYEAFRNEYLQVEEETEVWSIED